MKANMPTTPALVIADLNMLAALLIEHQKPLLEKIANLEHRLDEAKVSLLLYSPATIAAMTEYKPETVRAWIKEGLLDKEGNRVRLQAKEITARDYRVSHKDLMSFISTFNLSING